MILIEIFSPYIVHIDISSISSYAYYFLKSIHILNKFCTCARHNLIIFISREGHYKIIMYMCNVQVTSENTSTNNSQSLH